MRIHQAFAKAVLAGTLLLGILSFPACSPKGKEIYVPMTLTDVNTGEEIIADGSSEKDGRIIIEDALHYRGVISGLVHKDGATELTLEQAAGTSFGAASIPVVLSGETRLSFDRADMADGKYLEIYYQAAGADQPIQALAANLLPDAAVSVFNGSVAEILQEDGYTLSLLRLTDGETVLFHCNDDTAFYLDKGSIKAGDKINIFTNGLEEGAEPLEGVALEIRAYAE